MKNKFVAVKQKLKNPVVTHLVAASGGGIVVAAVYLYMETHGRAFHLPKEPYNALVNGDTNFVRFIPSKHEHVFRITLEQ